jgi:pimeloyl-ACP methyl ester carboxylesterase
VVAYVRHGEVRLAHELAGRSGDPVVLVHGGWEDHRGWDRVVPGLAVGLQVLTYDRRGHGESTGPRRPRPVRDDAADLAHLLESTGRFPTHLVAQGYGGAVAFRLVADRPELVRSIVVHEVPILGLPDVGLPRPGSAAPSVEELTSLRELVSHGTLEAAAREYLARFASPEEQWSRLDEASRRTLLENAGAWADEMGDDEATRPSSEELRSVTVPVLLTAGGTSPEFAARVQDRLAAELPNATSVHLPEGGHFLHRGDPDLLVGLLGTFLLERNVPTT